MVTSKVAGLLCPMFLKQAVDALSTSLPPAVAAAAALKAVVSFGACDILKHAAKEMQHPIFTPVSQVSWAVGTVQHDENNQTSPGVRPRAALDCPRRGALSL